MVQYQEYAPRGYDDQQRDGKQTISLNSVGLHFIA